MAVLKQETVDAVGRELIEKGLIVEAGFAGYQLMYPIRALAFDGDPQKRAEVLTARERRAFFAGAQHLFASIMNSGLDDGVEETAADMRRMDNIARELKRFEEQMLRDTTH